LAQRSSLYFLGALGFALACSSLDRAESDDGGFVASGAVGGSGQGKAGGGGSGGTTPPPETETDETFRAPIVSGRFLWTANPLSGKVALIDAITLAVRTADAGIAPTFLAALGPASDSESSAAVLNVGNDTVSILHATAADIDVRTARVHAEANRLSVSPSGRRVIAWADASLIPNVDSTEGLQDITVLDLGSTPVRTQRLTVGYRPSHVVIGDDERHAYVVAEPGISVIEMSNGAPASVVRDVSVTLNPSEAPSARDVTVTGDGAFAFVRRDGRYEVEVLRLRDGRTKTVSLPGTVTDLDVSPDGELAFAVMRATSGGGGRGGTGGAAGNPAVAGTAGSTGGAGASAGSSGNAGSSSGSAGADNAGGAGGEFAAVGGEGGVGSPSEGGGGVGGEDATAGAPAAGAPGSSGAGGEVNEPDPVPSLVAVFRVDHIFENPEAFSIIRVEETVGSIAIAPAGDVAVLYTNAVASDRVTILRTEGLLEGREPKLRTVLVKAPVRAVVTAPDGEHAVVLLGQAQGSTKPGGFSLVPLKNQLPPKILGTEGVPLSVAIGEHEALITLDSHLEANNHKVYGVYLARLPELATELIPLASPPLSAALIPEAGRGLVAQSHPEGRITFVELGSGTPRTLTGFELAARVVEQ
jgi:hypothetical protein